LTAPGARAVLAIAALLSAFGCAPNGGAHGPLLWKPVTVARLLAADSDDGWLMYRRTYDGHAHVPFTNIDAANVSRLRVAFTFDDGSMASHEAAPIINGR